MSREAHSPKIGEQYVVTTMCYGSDPAIGSIVTVTHVQSDQDGREHERVVDSDGRPALLANIRTGNSSFSHWFLYIDEFDLVSQVVEITEDEKKQAISLPSEEAFGKFFNM